MAETCAWSRRVTLKIDFGGRRMTIRPRINVASKLMQPALEQLSSRNSESQRRRCRSGGHSNLTGASPIPQPLQLLHPMLAEWCSNLQTLKVQCGSMQTRSRLENTGRTVQPACRMMRTNLGLGQKGTPNQGPRQTSLGFASLTC